ncbi:hypothetical protein PghCCS26_10800 [Paenibacillus glycanilyticus]|uniref:Polymer-forming cytoskeletal protein n=1 Tax=Paenibacillus glycanilyticus TaxID=126569 RepID=A0ABQ6NGU1_9BACL|nr:hypothetical protein [Paenibacillus glycanilyticus]GMK43953.1 hypothetical protein PghCCS26_10800 [Paenibacillus glycanilyticus]
MILVPGVASASSIFEHQNTTVPVEQTVDDVYVVGGDADVLGHVKGVIVVINGSLHIGSTAKIDGVVVVIGGEVNQVPGAVLGDDLYDISLDNATQNSLLLGSGIVAGLWVVQLAASLLLILVPVLIRLLGKKKIASFTERFQSVPTGRLLSAGFLSGIAIAALSLLLLVTVVGIPVLILVLIAAIIAVALGLTVISYWIGDRIKWSESRPDWLKVLIGAALLAAFSNIPIIGWLLFLVVAMFSLGICTLWIAGKRKRKA